MNIKSTENSPLNIEYKWDWEGRSITVVGTKMGAGKKVILLPAFSTASSRTEMYPLGKLLSQKHETLTCDWPGFGDSDRPPLDYNPELYKTFLKELLENQENPVILIAAGHAVGYALDAAISRPQKVNRLCTIAPTWRGPLPTMMRKTPSSFNWLNKLIETPIIGDILYNLNTSKPILKYMYDGHVYSDSANITTEFINNKQKIIRQKGGKLPSAAFVTGKLDPHPDRESFLETISRINLPILNLIPTQAPPKSTAEMQAIPASDWITNLPVPGSLATHEECATAIHPLIDRWLTD
jgi:pimeloyl-ACP methyl ester carboxylesterase